MDIKFNNGFYFHLHFVYKIVTMRGRSAKSIFLILSFLYIVLSKKVFAPDVRRHPNWNLLDHNECGISLADRIIGGTNATMGQYPWLARIGYIDNNMYSHPVYKCGGSLINKLYVVTAAHCVDKIPDNSIIAIIRLGEHNSLTEIDCEGDVCSAPVQDFRPVSLIIHKYYGKPAYKNDIALIRLNRPAIFNGWVQPICLPSGNQLTKNYRGSVAEVAGWGVYNMNPPRSSYTLRYVRLPVVDREICTTYFQKYADIGPTQLCVGGVIGEDSCGGDSGGPLVKAEAQHDIPRYYIIGIVSFGARRCGATEMPGVYTRMASYVLWILNNISN